MPENTVPAEFVNIQDFNTIPEEPNPLDGKFLMRGTDGKLKVAPVANFKKEIQTGIVSDATPSSSPTAYNPTDYPDGLYEKYDVKTAGTYTNFLDANTPTPQPIQVTTDDLANNYVQIWVKNGVSQKVLSGKPQPKSIVSNVKTGSTGLIDTYTITYSDGSTSTYEVKNGADANSIVSNVKTSTSGLVDTYTITYSNGTTTTYQVTNGANPKSIVSNVKTSTVGLIDTYTITYSDGTTTTYEVKNGANATVAGKVELDNHNAVSGDEIYRRMVRGDTMSTYNTWETGYYFNTGAPSTGTAYGMERTPKFLLKAGQKLKFGVNTYNVAGSTAAILNTYNLDGTFKANIYKHNDYLNQFKELEHIALVDELVALGNFSTSTIGQKYIEIHSLTDVALDPMNLRITTLEDSQSEIFEGTTDLMPGSVIPVNLDSYYLYTGATGGTGSGHKRTDKFLLPKGRTVAYGVNVATTVSSYAILNIYKLDGTFLANIKRNETAILGTFYTGSYTAEEDVRVGISDYTTGNYGTAYVDILAEPGNNYEKGLNYVLDNIDEKVEKDDYELSQMYLRGRAALNLNTVKKYGIIIAGQSNAEGRVPIAQLPSYIASNDNTVPNVQMWNDNVKAFQPFKYGVNTGSARPGQTSALTLYAFDAIASYLLAQNKAQTIYLVKRAQGGTAISPKGLDGGGWWTPRFENITTGRKLLEDLKIKVLNALAATPDLEFKAVLWHQGESDSVYAASVEYYQNFREVIEFIRGIVGNPTLPFIFGTIAPVSLQYSAKVNDAFNKVFAEEKFVYLINMSDGTLLDSYHFDATSTQNLGTRMFDVLKNL